SLLLLSFSPFPYTSEISKHTLYDNIYRIKRIETAAPAASLAASRRGSSSLFIDMDDRFCLVRFPENQRFRSVHRIDVDFHLDIFREMFHDKSRQILGKADDFRR